MRKDGFRSTFLMFAMLIFQESFFFKVGQWFSFFQFIEGLWWFWRHRMTTRACVNDGVGNIVVIVYKYVVIRWILISLRTCQKSIAISYKIFLALCRFWFAVSKNRKTVRIFKIWTIMTIYLFACLCRNKFIICNWSITMN